MTDPTGEVRRQALGRGWLETDAAHKPIDEAAAGHGMRAFFTLPVWGPYVSEERYYDEKFAYENAVGRAGSITTSVVVELPPAEIDLTRDAEASQPSA